MRTILEELYLYYSDIVNKEREVLNRVGNFVVLSFNRVP